MKEYLRILKNVLENGVPKAPVRFNSNGEPIPVENGTIGTFCEVFRHNMSEGFPLLTTKKMSIKNIAVELEGFIKGETSKKWYKDRGCNIWNEWANPQKVKDEKYRIFTNGKGFDAVSTDEQKTKDKLLEKQIQSETDDLGPIYGYQWRKFNEYYGDMTGPEHLSYYDCMDQKASPVGFDQLKSIVDKLKTNPYDRRMVCSAWNPNQMDMMALPPCHFAWNVVVYGNKLNLVWHQRSCDLFLGVPYNIASYALLLLLLAKDANLEPGELVGTLNDCHLYDNQIEQAKLQLTREPKLLPKLEITGNSSIFEWTANNMILSDYNSHEKIKADVTV